MGRELDLRTTRAVERLRALLPLFGVQKAALEGLLEAEPELEPEIRAMQSALADAMEAWDRALSFLDARLDVS